MKSINRFRLFLYISLSTFIILLAFLFFFENDRIQLKNNSLIETGVRETKVSINIDNKFNYNLNLYGEDSLINLLDKLSAEQNLKISYKDFSFGKMIVEINDIKPTENQYWEIIHNEKPANVGVSDLKIIGGDTIQFNLVNF